MGRPLEKLRPSSKRQAIEIDANRDVGNRKRPHPSWERVVARPRDIDLLGLAALITARLLELDGVDLEFTPDALDAIADQANLRGTGARGLRAILEEVLQPVMYEVPSRKDVERVVITREAVLENVNPTIVPRDVTRRTPREKSA